MSRQVSANPADWSEADVLYLAQYDQRMDEVKARADELGIEAQLPQPGNLPAPVRPEGGLSDYSLTQLLSHLKGRRQADPDAFDAAWEEASAELGDEDAGGTYDGQSKAQLIAELDSRAIEYPSGATKAELIDLLIADDNAGG
jgi:hypothetical protein